MTARERKLEEALKLAPRVSTMHRVAGVERTVLARAVDERTDRVLVVYRLGDSGMVHAAKVADWQDPVPHAPVTPANGHVRPRPGSHWRHFKGTTYRIVATAFRADTGVCVVVYKADVGGRVWVRPLAVWYELVKGTTGRPVARFVEIR